MAKIADKLDQEHVLVTADMAIYSKAQQILWGDPGPLQNKITMHIGNMHLIMTYISCIGKLFGDGGLLLALTESGVYAECSARQMVQGKHLDRGVRGIKIAHEAFYRLLITSASEWYSEQGIDLIGDTAIELLEDLTKACESQKADEAGDLIEKISPYIE